MRKLKAKFKRKKFKKIPINLPKIKKLGKWCEYYEGVLPYPINCQWNKQIPACFDKPNCKTCKRDVHFQAWKAGMWDHIKFAIQQGEDLTDMNAPNQEIE